MAASSPVSGRKRKCDETRTVTSKAITFCHNNTRYSIYDHTVLIRVDTLEKSNIELTVPTTTTHAITLAQSRSSAQHTEPQLSTLSISTQLNNLFGTWCDNVAGPFIRRDDQTLVEYTITFPPTAEQVTKNAMKLSTVASMLSTQKETLIQIRIDPELYSLDFVFRVKPDERKDGETEEETNDTKLQEALFLPDMD